MRVRVGRLALLVLGTLSLAAFRPIGLTDGGTVPHLVAVSAGDATAPVLPRASARATLVTDWATDTVLFERLSAERVPPASLTKLMTALLIAETVPLDETVTIEAADLVGGSSVGLAAGETMPVRDLLAGALVASGNDAATALARHAGRRLPGTEPPLQRFVEQMNARARRLGLARTTFRNPAGLDQAGHLSTAADLATLTRAALQQPPIAHLVASSAVTLRSNRRTFQLRTTNQLLGQYPGTLGVKTGTTDDAGECLIALVERGGRRLLVVVLGSSDRYADTSALLDWAFSQHRWVTPPNGLVATLERTGWSVALAAGPPIVVPVAQVQFINYRLQAAEPGRGPAGSLEVYVFDHLRARRDVLAVPLGRSRPPLPGW